MPTTYTSDGSLSDTQAKIDGASAGDTVQIPAGTFTNWGASGAFLSVNKAITLQGASQSTTTISLSSSAGTFGNATIRVSAANAIIKSFTYTAAGGSGSGFSIQDVDGWRVTDIKWTGASDGYFSYVENAYGVFDSNDITGASGTDELIFVRSKPDSWTTASSMGTAIAVYIEDNTFRGSGYVCDFNSYGRGCIRYNLITGQIKIDGHGKYTNTPARGVRQMEVYSNHWTFTTSGNWPAIELRGGTGMVYNNTADGTPFGILLQQYEVSVGGQTSANYPIDDQIGVGQDPKAGASEPMYLWSNLRSGVQWFIDSYADMTGVINADRDYYLDTTSFTGASGIGVGVVASRPGSASHTNVGYWATDQSKLYAWNGSAWVQKYTPYTYPHPLRAGGAPAAGLAVHRRVARSRLS